MAINVTLHASTANTTASSIYDCGSSAAPTSNALIIAFIHSAGTSNATPTISGHGLTWLQIGDSPVAASTDHIWCFSAYTGTAPTTQAFAFQYAAGRNSGTIHELVVTGGYLLGTSTDAVVQWQSTNSASGSNASVTLNAAADSSNRALAFTWHQAAEPTNPRASWTELADSTHGGPARGLETQWRSDAFETTASATFTTSSPWRIDALELRIAAAAGTVTNYLRLRNTMGVGR